MPKRHKPNTLNLNLSFKHPTPAFPSLVSMCFISLMLAARLQTEGFEFTDLTILRIEQGKRFVPDYEIAAIADYFHVSADYLLGIEKKNK